MFGMSKIKEGSREDYLMGAVYWQVATPEELEEWRNFQRPKFLESWDRRIKYLKEDLVRKIQSLHESAISVRREGLLGSIEDSLNRAHRYELEAAFWQDRLDNGNYDTPFYPSFRVNGY